MYVQRSALRLLALLLLLTGVLRAQDPLGAWQGTLHVGNGLRVILKIEKADQDKLSAVVYSIDQGPDGINAADVTVNRSDLRFTVPLFNGEYKGQIAADDQSITGTWTQDAKPNPLNFARPTPQATWPIDPAHHTVQLITVAKDTEGKDVKLEVLDYGGTGRPLVFLTGFGNNAHVFDNFAPKFIAKYHVYAITRRGFGASSSPAFTVVNYKADRLADDVLAIIDNLKLNRPVLVGHSIAGEELSSIGSRHPEKVSGLIYLDAGYGYALYNTVKGDYFLDMITVKDHIDQIEAGTDPNQKQTMHELLASVTALKKDLEEVTTQMASMPDLPPPPPIMRAVQFGSQQYTKLDLPVLAIFALPHDFGGQGPSDPAAKAAMQAADTARTTAQADAFEAQVPKAHVVRFPHANHYIFNSNEAGVIREMNAFLATLP